MARRRVFQVKVECAGTIDVGLISNRNSIIGRSVILEKSALTSEVSVCLDGRVIGHLDTLVGSQVTTAINRGVLFVAVIKKAYQNYDDASETYNSLNLPKGGVRPGKGPACNYSPGNSGSDSPHRNKVVLYKDSGHNLRRSSANRCAVFQSAKL